MTPESVARATPAAWLSGVDESFSDAAAGALSVRRLRVGADGLAVAAATPEVERTLTRAFGHLPEASPDEVALEVRIWDSGSSGAVPPPLPPVEGSQPRGTVLYYDDGAVRAAYQPKLGVLTVLDAAAKQAWFWCEDVSSLPLWERAAPLRQLFHWWLPLRGAQLVHGAAVGRSDKGVLLVGPSGSGKSTTALSCLASDLLYAADDYCAVTVGAEPRVLGLYSSGKVIPSDLGRTPHLAGLAADSDEEKDAFYLHERYGAQTTPGFPLGAVAVARIGSETRVEAIPAALALRALAPSTLLQMHPADPSSLARMTAVVARVPTFLVQVGPDTAEIPAAIGRLLDSL